MKIAIVCNYVLKPNRIGGMDRFFKLFDEQLNLMGIGAIALTVLGIYLVLRRH